MPPEPVASSQTENELSFEESVATLVQNLPGPVRAYVTGPEPAAVVLELTRKYRLHVDQATELHQALLMMLLGVYSPDQFVTLLEGKGFDAGTVNGILTDLNERVFSPLRKKEQGDSKQARSAPVPAPAARPSAPLAPVPAPLSPAPSAAPLPVVPPPLPAPAPVPAAAVIPPAPPMRTMAHDVEAMESGHAAAPVAYQAPISAPAPAPMPPSAPAPSAAPAAWSAAVPAPQNETPAPHPSRTFETPDPKEVRSTLQKYGIDPYRELPE